MALTIRAKSKTEAEIYIYDVIGDYWGEGVTAKQFVKELNALKVDTIHLHINSPGGNVFDGSTIYNALRQHKAKIIVHIDGLAASASSLIAMAGNEIQISGNAFIMIHHPWTFAMGNANELRHTADDLDLLTEMFAKTYAARAKGKTDYDAMLAYMDEETWFNAETALEVGLADTITESLEMAAKFDLERFKYKNIPAKAKEVSALPKEAAWRARIASMHMAVTRFQQTAAANRQGKPSRR